ncbi:hypothetical protein DWB58_30350 [candidate division KSB1 bacterium]|nr:hypothetical protein [candidate division KSB1 bacterium]
MGISREGGVGIKTPQKSAETSGKVGIQQPPKINGGILQKYMIESKIFFAFVRRETGLVFGDNVSATAWPLQVKVGRLKEQ